MLRARTGFKMLAMLITATAVAAAPTLRPASRLQFPHATDSNSPGHWDGPTFYLFNSTGHPYRSYGSNIFQLGNTAAVTFNNTVNGGRWMEATWWATNGTLYGWYHNEPGGLCPSSGLTAPKIGAAKSTDNGANWTDLGIILEAQSGTLKCDSQNGYFAGGNGDFSVMLDDAQQYLYLFISTYAGDVTEQGVAVARMAWSDRDAPVGKVWKWYNGAWQSAGVGGHVTPTFPATVAWEFSNAQAYWGPSVHWNTYLHQYVMLLNRANSGNFGQEGIYISYSTNLADPLSWSAPEKILNGGAWYPQVIGLEQGQGTDKSAGALARYFQGGVSDYEICFGPTGCPSSPCAWNQFLDGSSLPGPPWQADAQNEGSTVVTNIGGGNYALQMNSFIHTNATGSPGQFYNEWYVYAFGAYERVGAARFRLVGFTTGKENLLSVTIGGGALSRAPSITLVTNRYKVWSYTSDVEIFDLGPAVTNEWHTAYILARTNGTGQVWWDGAIVFDGPMPATPDYDGYVEFGSGTYWQTTAAATVDFDWVGYGDACNLPLALRITRAGNAVVIAWPTNALGFVLQSTESLSPANWTDATNTVGVVGSENTVTNSLSDTTKFFRLRKL